MRAWKHHKKDRPPAPSLRDSVATLLLRWFFALRLPRPAVTMLRGSIKWFKPDKNYGFISPDDGSADVFFHQTNLKNSGAFSPALLTVCASAWGWSGLEPFQLSVSP